MVYLSNELDLLDLRLHELNDIVDKIIIVEYPFDYGRRPAIMHYNENKERFKEFEHKIIHVIDDNDYQHSTGITLMWQRKNSPVLMQAVSGCKDEDYIFACDGDAVVRREAFQRIDLSKQSILRLRWCIYWMNLYCPHVGFDWVTAAPYKIYKERGSFAGMSLIPNPDIQLVDNAGWHFSKLGGVDKVIANIMGYPHQEYRQNLLLIDPVLVQERIDNAWGWDDITKGKGEKVWHWEYTTGADLPPYVQAHPEIFKQYIKEI